MPPSVLNVSKNLEMITSSLLLDRPSGAKGQAVLSEPHPDHPNQDSELNSVTFSNMLTALNILRYINFKKMQVEIDGMTL